MKTSIILKTGFALVVLLCFSSAFAGNGKDEPGKDKRRITQSNNDYDGKSYFHKNGFTQLNIPKGHFPPPGQCRIWYPDKPPGHQPPPGNCRDLRRQVPPGAWIIRHPESDPKHIHVDVYDPQNRGKVMVTGEFDLGGVFIRIAAAL